MEIIIYYLVVINLISFIMFGIDKQKAKQNKYRISERTLLLTAFIGGSIGAFLGMHIFRHKTKHARFLIAIPLMIVVHCGVVVYWVGAPPSEVIWFWNF